VSKFTAHDDSVEAHYAGLERLEPPHGCIGGYVFLGHLVDEDGEEREIIESVPCRRCAEQSA
jgi:hypothetical protein